MDDTLSLKLDQLKQAIKTLKDALDEKESELARDAVIKRFEYTFELCWKTSKVFLNIKFGVDVYSPKEVFRGLRKNKFITDDETRLCLEMTDDRNEVIHTYSESFSNELYEKIREYYFELINKIYKVLKNNKL